MVSRFPIRYRYVSSSLKLSYYATFDHAFNPLYYTLLGLLWFTTNIPNMQGMLAYQPIEHVVLSFNLKTKGFYVEMIVR